MAQKIQLLLVQIVSFFLRFLVRLRPRRLFGPRLVPADSEITWSIYADEPPGAIRNLLHRWRKRDGAEFLEVGNELSRSLVKSPRRFITAMQDDQESFSEWLDSLDTHTFTMFQAAGDELDDELYYAYHRELYRKMRKALSIRHFMDRPDLARTAKVVRRHLSRIDIRRIV